MNLPTTRALQAQKGPLVLVSGLVVVGMVLMQVASTPTSLSADAAGLERDAEVTTMLRADGMGGGRSILEAEASGRRLATPLVRYRNDSGSYGETDAADAAEAAGTLALQQTQDAGSTAAWTDHFAALDDAALLAELPLALGQDAEPNQQAAYLKVTLERGGELGAAAFGRAITLPDVAPRGSVSLPSFAIGLLERRATDPELRPALEAAAWDAHSGLVPRLRGRAAAALVRTAGPDQLQSLHDHLYAERDAHVLASALGAARMGSKDLRLALADLYPDEDLIGLPDRSDMTLAELERLAL